MSIFNCPQCKQRVLKPVGDTAELRLARMIIKSDGVDGVCRTCRTQFRMPNQVLQILGKALVLRSQGA